MKTSLQLVVCLALAAASSACGGRSDPLGADEALGDPPDRPIEAAAAPIWVPAGEVILSGFKVDPMTQTIGYEVCTLTGISFPSVPFWVPGFFLDPDEVTVRAYHACVAAGGCADVPVGEGTREDLPASLGREDAAQYCRWRGGTLPSWAELRRGLVGDAFGTPAPPPLLWPWLDCARDGFAGAGCAALADRIPPGPWPSAPPRSNPVDVGPFGHYDLFGSQWEWTRDHLSDPYQDQLDADCMRAGDTVPDFTAGSQDLLFAPAVELAYSIHNYQNIVPITLPEEVGQPGLWGARCAYSP